MIVTVGAFMQQTAQGWLVLELLAAGDLVTLGIVGFVAITEPDIGRLRAAHLSVMAGV
jgi:hypothetical protein